MKTVLFASVLAVVGATSSAAELKIHVSSSWDGLRASYPGQAEPVRDFIVTCVESTCRSGAREIGWASVSELVDALQAPPLDHIRLSDLGITPEWLNAQVPLQIAKEKPQYVPEARQIGACRTEAFERHFGDVEFVRKVVEAHYRSRWTDDYPAVGGTVKLPDGREITFGSRAQQPFMIPWKVEVSGSSMLTYSTRVGKAIACDSAR